MVTFAWPWLLVALAAVPLVVVWYRRLLRTRAARRAELAALGLAGPAPGRRATVPSALLLGALALLLLALARPEIGVPLPRREGTVMLAFDVSSSMTATDLAPTRMDVAKAAARAVVERQPPTVRVGVVAFGTSGLVTRSRPRTGRACSPRSTGCSRAGDGAGRRAADVAERDHREDGAGRRAGHVERSRGAGPGPRLLRLRGRRPALRRGEHAEPDPVEVAELASTAGVRIYPIGIGSPHGTVIEVDGFQLATALDEPLLRKIAEHTDGRYLAAGNAAALAGVSDAIDLEWKVETEHIEVTGLLAAAAGLLVLAGAGLSLLWFGRVL